MFLDDLHKNNERETIINNHRRLFYMFKTLVVSRRFDSISQNEVNQEKELVIKHLNTADDEENIYDFEELTYYQERYLSLNKFLSARKSGKNIDPAEVERLVSMFEERYDTEKESKPEKIEKKGFHHTDSIEFDDKILKTFNDEKSMKSSISNVGLGKAVHDFFDKKQKESKQVGFKDLLDKGSHLSINSQSFKKKMKKPGHDIEIRKLLEENKRLHSQMEKRSKEDVELNEFEKNVLREEKERCMKRIEELEEEVEDLARNNYRLQEIERSKKAVSTFMNDSHNNSKNEYLPYYIPTRPNDLNVITEKNKITKANLDDKNNILMNLVSEIPPIEKKEQHSFDELGIMEYRNEGNNILEGLLEDRDENPKKEFFSGSQTQKNPLFIGSQEVRYAPVRRNDSIDHGSRFDSFSMAQTAYNSNNSSLFLNASKNLIAIDSVSSTRNKVAFFKNSLVIVKDEDFEIAFKKSSIDPSFTKIRLIFYINNKKGRNESVDIEYDYETFYYTFHVTEKLSLIGPYKQSREVVEISLYPNSQDLNSVVDVHFRIGDKKYDLWVPLCFIEWTSEVLSEKNEMSFMTVQPDRQFSNYEAASKILPLGPKKSLGDETQAFVYGKSKFGYHEIKLTWWEKELTIDASSKIIDFIGFIMHHFK